MTTNNCQKGFTLIEVVIALGVLSIGILGVMALQVSGIKGNSTAGTVTSESNWAADRIEQLLGLDYLDPGLVDNDGDGTTQDGNEDGVDDDGGNFGLDDVGISNVGGCVAAPADQCIRQGIYDIFWNVAIDNPIVNSKKIKVIVIHSGGKSNKVEFEYVKTDVI